LPVSFALTYTTEVMFKQAYFAGVQCAFEKLGFGLRDARQLLKATKDKIVRFQRDVVTGDPEGYFMRPLWGASEKRVPRIVAPRRGDVSRLDIKEMPEEAKVLLRDRGYRIYPTDALRDLRAMQPKERLMREAMSRGHELDELMLSRSGAPSSSFHTLFSHADPRVLLREHNRLTTLPAAYKRVGRVGKDIRASLGEAQELEKLIPGFRFGESPRLSRHAQRRLAPKIEEALQPAAQAKREADRAATRRRIEELLGGPMPF
jgi:hypothetical protein